MYRVRTYCIHNQTSRKVDTARTAFFTRFQKKAGFFEKLRDNRERIGAHYALEKNERKKIIC